jgi:hypothetical protein
VASTNTVLALYSAAGLLEFGGVSCAALDLRAKARAANEFATWGQVRSSETVRDLMRDQAAAARGQATSKQVQGLSRPLLAALRGPWLLVSAFLLLGGIVLGAVANALSVTR